VVVLCCAFGFSSAALSYGGLFASLMDQNTYSPSIDCENPNLMTGRCSCPDFAGEPLQAARIINDGNGQQQVGGYLWECTAAATTPVTSTGWGGSYQQDDDVSGGHGCRYPNQYTGVCSCPSGFTGITVRVLTDTHDYGDIIGSHITFCYIKPTSTESYAFGGAYQALSDGKCLVANPATSKCSCGSEFTIHQSVSTLVDTASPYQHASVTVCERGMTKLINVHAVPHTHDDVGWLETMDGYYECCVRNIITTVVDALAADPTRRFTYVEMAFFNKWWLEQSEDTRDIVRILVNEGRLDFTIGGWCMPDEASPTYTDLVDQMTAGHLFLKETFGEQYIPTVGWQIDPFGHSKGNAWTYQKFGFDWNLVSRIDHQDLTWRRDNQELEFIWHPFDSFDSSQDILSYVTYDGSYCWPPGRSVQGSASITDKASLHKPRMLATATTWNPTTFAHWVYNVVGDFKTNEIMATMGCDFEWQNAEPEFEGLDALIAYYQAHPEMGINMFYSTPTRYAAALKSYTDLKYSIKTDDFFGYADYVDDYWSGYFTSHPAFKRHIRASSALFHSARQIHALASGDKTIAEQLLTPSWHAIGVTQHHDAITGTSKSFVYDDYNTQLDEGNTAATSAILFSLAALDPLIPSTWSVCPVPQEETAYCAKVSTGSLVAVYNPLARPLDTLVTLDVADATACAVSLNGTVMPSQTRPVYGGATYELAFVAQGVPALGFATYKLQQCNSSTMSKPASKKSKASTVTLENQFVALSIDGATGMPIQITDKTRSVSMPLSVDVLYYVPENSPDDPRSGAYVFASNTPASNFPGPRKNIVSNFGPVFQELQVDIDATNGIQQRFRLYYNSPFIEVTTKVGPISVADNYGKEVVVRVNSAVSSAGALYTDSHGLEFTKHMFNELSDKWTVENPISGNFYPVSMAGYIRDDQNILAVVTDRGQGMASLVNGSIETMIHRRLTTDGDHKGVGEPLDDASIISARHMLLFSSASSGISTTREGALKLEHQPVVMVAQSSAPVLDWSPMATALPQNVHLQTLQVTQYDVTGGAYILLRLHHTMAVGEDSVFSKPATVDLQSLFKNWAVTSATEVSMSAAHTIGAIPLGDTMPVVIQPMDIRTFAVKLQSRV